MVIIMQHCNVDLEEVFKYPLGPLPWLLSDVLGELSSNTNEVIRAILNFFIQEFHKRKKHKTFTSKQK